jgi:YidC/Oxa1 family membrane protein insertase
VKQKKWLLLATLVIVALVLSGCGVPHQGVDVTTTAPSGPWQFVVWQVAKALIWLDTALQNANIPYHWGFAIILFTVLIKAVTFPLNLTQIRGMQAQKELQPKIQELQKKYGKDREKLAQEQMKLYQEAGVNPLSGCLPLLVQMPILFALYAALVALGPNFVDATFFWIPDLAFPHYNAGLGWITEAFNAGDYGTLIGYLVLPALLIATQFVMQKWMTATTPSSGDSQAQMMQQMSLMMTFMFGFFTLTVPAGLTLYWVISNLLQMLQQWIITSGRFNLTGAKPAPAVAATKTPSGGSKSVSLISNGASSETALTTVPTEEAPERNPTPTQAKRRKARRK